MIELAISILWLAIGILVLLGVVWLVLYGIKIFAPIPPRIEQLVWVVVLILCLIGILSLLSGSGDAIRVPRFR